MFDRDENWLYSRDSPFCGTTKPVTVGTCGQQDSGGSIGGSCLESFQIGDRVTVKWYSEQNRQNVTSHGKVVAIQAEDGVTMAKSNVQTDGNRISGTEQQYTVLLDSGLVKDGLSATALQVEVRVR